MSKVKSGAAAALQDVLRDGMTLAVGGFGLSGIPADLIEAVRDSGVKDLTVVSNNMGVDGKGLGVLIEAGQVRKVIASYVGENKLFAEQYLAGKLEVEFTPQGTLAERLRAGGAGIPAFYTKTGVGTLVAEGKPLAEFDGETYVQERAIKADVALVHAHTADTDGNLIYRYTAQNFNPVVATAGAVTVAEAEVIVEPGAARPEPHRHPRRLRPAPGPGQRPGQGHRTAHRPAPRRSGRGGRRCRIRRHRLIRPERRHPHFSGETPWLGPGMKWPPSRPKNSTTAITSTSASASPRWSPTTCATASASCCRARTACSAWARSPTRARRTRT